MFWSGPRPPFSVYIFSVIHSGTKPSSTPFITTHVPPLPLPYSGKFFTRRKFHQSLHQMEDSVLLLGLCKVYTEGGHMHIKFLGGGESKGWEGKSEISYIPKLPAANSPLGKIKSRSYYCPLETCIVSMPSVMSIHDCHSVLIYSICLAHVNNLVPHQWWILKSPYIHG